MAKSDKKTVENADPIAMGQALMREFESAGFGSVNWMGTAWFEAMADMNSELVTFVAGRIREDVKAQHEMLHCKTAQELQQAQTAFLEKAYTQYTEETGKLVKMGLDMLPLGTSGTKHTPV